MDPRNVAIYRLAPELADALDPAELAAMEHALAEAEPDVRRALAGWLAMRQQLSGDLAADIPPPGLMALYALTDEAGVLAEDEQARLEESRGQIERALARHSGLESVVDRVRADRQAFYQLWDEEAHAESRLPRHTDRPPAAPARDRAPAAGRWVWRVAVAAGLALFVAALIFVAQRDIGFETITTAEGESVELALPDGSEVRIAPNSTFAYQIREGAERRVRLTGEALFDVIPADEPFVVETHEALVLVIGTTFSVSSDAAATEVVLVHGAVEVRNRLDPEQSVRLAEGQRSRVLAGSAPESPESVDVIEALAWTGNWYFRATPLADIAARLEAHYGVSIVVPTELARERLSGSFSQQAAVEETLQTLAAALGIQVERDAPGTFRFAAGGA